jgi:hypothetical protein
MTRPGTQLCLPYDLGWALARVTFQVAYRLKDREEWEDSKEWVIYVSPGQENIVEERMELQNILISILPRDNQLAQSFTIDEDGCKALKKLFDSPPPPVPKE